ncbi:helix-turn-helix domain-containing protein [Myxococcus landrumensis]|uniref:Helix-turn-helix domain-containing protein n=1 Tax=Myxococcus landrumensis TaxID=2813577 RepID=A0ABX7NFR6_9BACT|nr:helix-turn-helix domain-containing protein [Myxococcus landrumus]QSQ17654.1 helix-turn-helix domain-containing protein [Myxococcus landrumus]
MNLPPLFVLAPETGFFVLRSNDAHSAPHRQWGTAILFGLEGPVTVLHAAGSTQGRIVVVPGDVPHVTRSRGPLASVLLDADVHRATLQALQGRPPFTVESSIVLSRVSALVEPGHPDVERGISRAVEGLFPTGSAPLGDGRIARLLGMLGGDEALPLPVLAARLKLSAGHVSTLFHSKVGIPLRRWLLWRRLVRSMPLLRVGSLAQTAALAGFADQAHLTRTCVRFAGYTPGHLAQALCPGA